MDEKTLERFFNGKSSPEEQRKVLAWYLSDDADHALSAKIEQFWEEEDKKTSNQWGKDIVFDSIGKQITITGQAKKVVSKKRRIAPRQQWIYWRKAAAIFLFITSLSGLYYYFFYQNPFLTSEQKAINPTGQEKIFVKETARGEKLTIILRDSTVIKLNSESQLRYSSASEREVYLEGEAFFEVARDTLHPFLIHTGDITTTVLGTSFNIKAFANEKDIAISVVTGKVKVEKANYDQLGQRPIHLIPGEQAVYRIDDTLFTKKNFDFQHVLSWKDGRLYFKNARFSDVVSTLERWYGVEIEVKRRGIENGFSGSYSNRSLESILEGIGFVLDFKYEIQDKKIIIK